MKTPSEMNAETPRTDAMEIHERDVIGRRAIGGKAFIHSDFARQLEREQAPLHARIVELEKSYALVKEQMHTYAANLETLLDQCCDHADGTSDATPLAKFCNEMIGVSNSIMLKDLQTLRSERDQLRKVCDELAYCLQNPAIFQRMESIEALSSYNSLPHVIERNKPS